MARWKLGTAAFLTLLAVQGTHQRAQAQGANVTVNFSVPPGSNSVNIAGTYGPNHEFTIDNCQAPPLGCSGLARFWVDPGPPADNAGLTDLMITANVAGTLTLNFFASLGPVPSGLYAWGTGIDGAFVPASDGPFGGLSYTLWANGDVINAIPPGPNDVGPTLQFSNADLAGSTFDGSVVEGNIACFGSGGGPCTWNVTASITFVLNAAGDRVFIPNSVSIAASRITGAAGVHAIETALTNAAHVRRHLTHKGDVGMFGFDNPNANSGGFGDAPSGPLK